MWKALVGTVVVLWFAQLACGGSLLIKGTWQADSELSCSITLKIEKQVPDEVSLLAWQLVCQIAPRPGSPTNAVFTPLSSYMPPASSCVFGNHPSTIYRVDDETSTTFSAITDDFAGVPIQSTNTDLLQFSLTSPDAVGTFDIVLAPYIKSAQTGSCWTPDGSATAEPFCNQNLLQEPQEPFVVATIVFPEPPSGLLFISGVAALILVWVARGSCHTAKIRVVTRAFGTTHILLSNCFINRSCHK